MLLDKGTEISFLQIFAIQALSWAIQSISSILFSTNLKSLGNFLDSLIKLPRICQYSSGYCRAWQIYDRAQPSLLKFRFGK